MVLLEIPRESRQYRGNILSAPRKAQMLKKIIGSACICASLMTQQGFAAETIDPEALFAEAMQYREDGELFRSIEIFETILSNQPDLNRARLELAVSYHLTRRYEQAKEQLTKVLNDPNTPEAVRLSITAYLAQLSGDIKASANRSKSSLYLSAGLFTDSNINLGPDSKTIGGDVLFPLAQVKSSHGAQFLASFSNRSRASKPLEISGNIVDFEWLTQATAYNKSYTADSSDSDFDLSVLSLSTGPALIRNKSWRTAINFKLEKILFGNDPYAFFLSFNPLFTYSLTPSLEITIENTTTVKEYDDSVLNAALKGTASIWAIDIAQFYSKQNIGLQAGAKYHDNGAETLARHYTGTEVYLGGQMPAWKDARAYLTISGRNYKYQGIDTNFTEIRDETETRAVLGVNHNFKSGKLKSWTLNAQTSYTDNDSNLDAFKYDRTLFEVNMRRYFL
jgi:tetratricopeptide (TPR) repeat protein